MAREYTTIIGSGSYGLLGLHPDLTDLSQRYPIPSQRDALKTRTGEGIVVLNPEDFSVFLGLSVQAVSVVTSQTALPPVPLKSRRALVLHNFGPDVLYIGPSGLSVATGFPLTLNEKISIDITGHPNMYIYGITTGTCDVRILELA